MHENIDYIDLEKKHWNPLYDLFEKNAKPNAYTLRTNFYEKIGATFKVFAGTTQHFGLFDYILVIPLMTQKTTEWLNKIAKEDFYRTSRERGWGGIVVALLSGLVGLLQSVLNLAKAPASVAFVLICLPFIGIAHAFSKIEGDPLKETINQWVGQPLLSLNHIQLEVSSEKQGKNSQQLLLHLTLNANENQNLKTNLCIAKKLDLTEDKPVLDALIALNIGGKAGELRFFKKMKEREITELDAKVSNSHPNEQTNSVLLKVSLNKKN